MYTIYVMFSVFFSFFLFMCLINTLLTLKIKITHYSYILNTQFYLVQYYARLIIIPVLNLMS